MNCIDQMATPFDAALQPLWHKYPLLHAETGALSGGVSLRIAYAAGKAHGSNGAFLRALASQCRLGHLLASYLAAHGIAARVDDDGAGVVIAHPQYQVATARSALLAALDALCSMLAAMRTDLLLEHRVATGRRRNQPYLDAGVAGTAGAADAAATIVVLNHAADADSLLAQDASLVTFDRAELSAAAALLRAWLPACELAPWTLQAGHASVRIVPVWLPQPATTLPAAALRAAQSHGSRHIAAAMAATPSSGGAAAVFDGRAGAGWLLAQATRLALRQAAATGGGNTLVVLGASAADNGWLAEFPGSLRNWQDNSRCAVLVLLPGAEPGPALTQRCVVLDLSGLSAGLVTAPGTLVIRGLTLSMQGRPLELGAQPGALAVQAALLEALCSRLRGGSGGFAAQAAALELALTGLRSAHGTVGPQHWRAFARQLPLWDYRTDHAGATVAHAALHARPQQPMNICDSIFAAAHLAGPGRLIDASCDAVLDYAALYAAASRCAHALARRGMAPGAVVALADADSCFSVALMLGCWLGGWVFCPLNYLSAPANAAAMLAAAAPALLLYGDDERCAALAALAPSAPLRVAAFQDQLGSEDATPYAARPLAPDQPAVMLFTSGSTGTPKAVTHSHADFRCISQHYGDQIIGLGADDCVHTPSRLYFAYGLNNLTMSLCAGASHVLATTPATMPTRDLIARHAVTVLFAVPAMYKLMLAAPAGARHFPALRLCVSAGEALPPRLFNAISALFGVAPLDGIGTTEVISTFISNADGAALPGCTGMLVAGFAAQLRAADGSVCRVGEVGSLWIKGNTVASAYLNDAALSARSFVDGWFNTNDMFFADHRRRFYHVGRNGHIIKINGCWFSPHLVEATLLGHAAVADCAVCVVHDAVGLARPQAFVVLQQPAAAAGLTALWNELRQLARSTLGKDHYPHEFTAVAALPRTASGKLNLQALLHQHAAPPVPRFTSDEMNHEQT